jgi:hypothetical protein
LELGDALRASLLDEGLRTAGDSSDGNVGCMEDKLHSIKRREERLEKLEAREKAARVRAKAKAIGEKMANPGLTKQFEFNAELLARLNDVKSHLKKLSGKAAKPPKALTAARTKLRHRQKLLRLADSYGWEVAEEYDGEDIASGSTEKKKQADAKRIAKAVKAATASAGPAKPKRVRFAAAQKRVRFAAAAPVVSTTPRATKAETKKKCFKCSQVGHIKQDCPN